MKKTADWFAPAGARAPQVEPTQLTAFGIPITSARADATEMRELLQFACTCALWDIETCVTGAAYEDRVCTITLAPEVPPSDLDRVRRAAVLCLSRSSIADEAERSGRMLEAARSLLAYAMKLGLHAFNAADIERLARLATDESGIEVDVLEVGRLFDRVGKRCTTIMSAMQTPAPAYEHRHRH